MEAGKFQRVFFGNCLLANRTDFLDSFDFYCWFFLFDKDLAHFFSFRRGTIPLKNVGQNFSSDFSLRWLGSHCFMALWALAQIFEKIGSFWLAIKDWYIDIVTNKRRDRGKRLLQQVYASIHRDILVQHLHFRWKKKLSWFLRIKKFLFAFDGEGFLFLEILLSLGGDFDTGCPVTESAAHFLDGLPQLLHIFYSRAQNSLNLFD